MKAQAVIRLKLSSKKNVDIILQALKPEAEKSTTSRSGVSIKSDKGFLTLEFEARDTSALRAAVNSYLHWISLSMNILSKLESLSKT